MRAIHSNVASVLGMSVTSKAVIYHSPATGSVTGSLVTRCSLVANKPYLYLARRRHLAGRTTPAVPGALKFPARLR